MVVYEPEPPKNGKNQGGYKPNPPKGGNKKERALKLQPGDVLIFEEVLGPITGLAADADPMRRHAVRITKVTPGEDQLRKTKDGDPTPYLEIEWGPEDALPFTFCVSAIGSAPDCDYLENVSVARGNVILCDHGQTQNPEDFGPVPTQRTDATCECVDEAGDVEGFSWSSHSRFEKLANHLRRSFAQRQSRDSVVCQRGVADEAISQRSRTARSGQFAACF